MRKRIKNLFIPHEGNNFRPDFLEKISVGIMLVLVLLSFTMANMQALLWINSDWLVSSVLPAVIVDLTNNKRHEESMHILTRNVLLDDAATLKAEDMAQKEYFAHHSPEGISPWHWFDAVSYDYLHAGENLAVHFTDSGDVVEAWMASPLHRANIMDTDYVEIGVGTAVGEYMGQPTIYVVQLFGTRREPSPPVTTTDVTTETEVNEYDRGAIFTQVATSEESIIATATTDSLATVGGESIGVPELVRTDVVLDPIQSTDTSATKDSSYQKSDTFSFYSDLATTSREGTPLATMQSSGTTPSYDVLMPLRAATEPSIWLTTLYGLFASIVVCALILSIKFEWRSHHPVQVVYAGGLLVIMALLLYIHTSITGIVTII